MTFSERELQAAPVANKKTSNANEVFLGIFTPQSYVQTKPLSRAGGLALGQKKIESADLRWSSAMRLRIVVKLSKRCA